MRRRLFLQRLGALSAGMGLTRYAVADEADGRFRKLLVFIRSEIQAGTVPGAGVAVTRHGETLFERYFGNYLAADFKEQPFDGAVVNCFFSFSKLVSATVLMTLVQEGLLELDAPISKQIPEFTGGGKEKITLRHLMTHSAGIPTVPLKAVGTPEEWERAVKDVSAAAVAWEPGSRCQYHGLTGLFVAAEAARRVTGKDWETLCGERLFGPLGSATLTFKLPAPGTKLSLVPRPPKSTPPAAPGAIYGSWLLGHPAGSCFGTPADMLKVLQLHLDKGQWEGKAILKPEAFRQMHTVQYQKEIDAAIKAGKPPMHQSWGLGPLLRGSGPADPGHAWFGFADRPTPSIFGHAGISTVIGIGDPSLDLALVFITTDKPGPESKTAPLRNGVTNRVYEAIAAV